MSTPPRKVQKTAYSQKFRKEWLEDDIFKEWLIEDKDEKGVCYCVCCKAKIKNANKSMLLAHSKTTKHLNNARTLRSTPKLDCFFTKPKSNEEEKVAKAELILSAYVAEHNTPFAHIDHLVDACRAAFPDSSIAKNVKMRATKVSYLVQDGIGYYEELEVSKACREAKFSLIIDESTDISVSQVLAIVVRYFDVEKGDVADRLLDSVTVENGTAAGLYSAVKKKCCLRRVYRCLI